MRLSAIGRYFTPYGSENVIVPPCNGDSCERLEPQGFGLALRAFISPSLLMTEPERSFYDSENAQI